MHLCCLNKAQALCEPFLLCSEQLLAWRRLQTSVTEPELADALASTAFLAEEGQSHDAEWARPAQARRLMAGAQPQLGVSNVSTDLDCDGCSTTDTRQQVLVSFANSRLQQGACLPFTGLQSLCTFQKCRTCRNGWDVTQMCDQKYLPSP